jgi:hypothetical protein
MMNGFAKLIGQIEPGHGALHRSVCRTRARVLVHCGSETWQSDLLAPL